MSTFIITDVKKALIERTQTTLRMVMGNRTLQDTIEHREQVASEIRIIIDEVPFFVLIIKPECDRLLPVGV